MLSQNRFSKYLLYALGEILLVVIGILIALQINNWNEGGKMQKLEETILLEMVENLRSDIKDIRANISFDSTNHVATTQVLDHLEGRESMNDALTESYGKLGWFSLFAENTSAYDNLKSLGFNLISNDKLRGKISYLYSTRYEYANEIFNSYNDFLYNQFHPVMIANVSSLKGDYFNKRPNDEQELFDNMAFIEMIRQDVFMKEFSININRSLQKEVLDLIQLIENEISQ